MQGTNLDKNVPFIYKMLLCLHPHPSSLLQCDRCNHGPGQHFMGASLITTRTVWPLRVPQRHRLPQPSPYLSIRTRLTVPSHHPPSLFPKHSPSLHPPMLTCSNAPVMSCRSKGHAWPVTVDWATDITALLGGWEHRETCLSPCQSFLSTWKLSNHVSHIGLKFGVTILRLTLEAHSLVLDIVHGK